MAALGIFAVALTALVAVLVTRPDGAASTPVVATTSPSSPELPTSPTAGRDERLESTQSTPWSAPAGPSESALRSVILDYYNAVLAGDFDEAWAMLSPSYREWKIGYNGKGAWLTAETDTYNRLTLGDIDVSLVSYDAATKIATIEVTGMTYSGDGGPCPYEGITWVRKFDGVWRYDPGFVQRPGREATWRPKKHRTLGYPCTG